MKTELMTANGSPYLVVMVRNSKDTGDYRVDVTNQRCDCPAWKFARPVGGVRQPCKHLKSLGFKPTAPVMGQRSQEKLPEIEMLYAVAQKDYSEEL